MWWSLLNIEDTSQRHWIRYSIILSQQSTSTDDNRLVAIITAVYTKALNHLNLVFSVVWCHPELYTWCPPFFVQHQIGSLNISDLCCTSSQQWALSFCSAVPLYMKLFYPFEREREREKEARALGHPSQCVSDLLKTIYSLTACRKCWWVPMYVMLGYFYVTNNAK